MNTSDKQSSKQINTAPLRRPRRTHLARYTENQNIEQAEGGSLAASKEKEKAGGFWSNMKTAFAWGFGGSFGAGLGWALSQWVVNLIKRAWGWIALAGAGHFGLPMLADMLKHFH